MADVDASAVKKAFKQRKEYILNNLDSVTLKTLRKQLEADLGLPGDALKPHKHLLSELIDKLIAKATAQPASAEKQPKAARPAKARSPQERKPAGEPAAKAGPRQYSKRVDKLRALCRQATITIAPSLYKNKDDDDLAAALEALLEKHGLSPSAGANEVARAKQQLQVQRDLDGIDTSNIVEGGRRGRGAAQVNYRKLVAVQSEGESGSEDEGSDGESSDASGNDSDGPSGAGSGSDAGDGEEAASPGDAVVAKKSVEGKRKAASSPNENHDGNSNALPPSAAKSPLKAALKKKVRTIEWSDDDE